MVFKIDIIDANSGHNSQYFLGMTTWRRLYAPEVILLFYSYDTIFPREDDIQWVKMEAGMWF